MMMCLGVGLFAFISFRTLSSSWTCMSISFTKLGKFLSVYLQIEFQFLALFSSPSGTPMMQMLESLKLSQRLIMLSSVFWILFSFCYMDWLFFASLCSKSLISFSALFILLLFPYKFFFISISVSFISHWISYVLLRSSLFLEHPYNQCFELCIW